MPASQKMRAVQAALLSRAPVASGKTSPLLFFSHQRASMLQSATFGSTFSGSAGIRHASKFHVQRQRRSSNSVPFKTLTYEDVEAQGLALKNGINDLPAEMQARLRARGATDLFPVQRAAFTMFAREKNELIVKSRTGTGKTLSFLLPLEYLLLHGEDEAGETATTSTSQSSSSRSRRNGKVRAIILEPTRELATQVQEQVEKFCSLSSCLLYGGGSSKQSQYNDIRAKRPELLVCTPGRLIDVMHSYDLDLSEVEYFVLDEGDRMLDMGF